MSLVRLPMPWLAPQWVQLMERHRQARLPHALLLYGSEGVGKGQLARLLAASLLCHHPSAEGLPCGDCPACGLLEAGSHPDLFLAHPQYGESGEEPGEGEEAAPRKGKGKAAKPSKQIKIECIRDLVDFSHHAAHQGGRRVALIEPAEAMNINAANALLKTLEEPGEGVFIVLVCHQPSRLLATVRSRSQAWFCPAPSEPVARQWLAQHIVPERAGLALAISGGAPLRALRVVEAGEDTLCQDVHNTLQAVREKRMDWVQAGEALAKAEPGRVLEWWWMHLHQLCCQRPEPGLLAFASSLLQAYRRVQGTANPNARLLLESLLIDWAALPAA